MTDHSNEKIRHTKQGKGGKLMTVAVQEKVRILKRNIRVNSKRINASHPPNASPKLDRAVVSSAAKYYETLKKLASE
jgi:hypothetical protein